MYCRDSGLWIPSREVALPRGARGMFSSAFRQPFQNAFASQGGVIPWYLSGGITVAQCAVAYQPKGAGSLATSYVNINNPGTNDAALGTAPTFDTATGWTFNGTTQYLKTGIIPNNNTTWSVIVRFSGATTNAGGLIGLDQAGIYFFIQPLRAGGTVVGYWSGSNGLSKSPQLASGDLCIAGGVAYRNGVAETGTISPGGGAFTLDLYIGALNTIGAAGTFLACTIAACAVYNVTLTDAQVLAVHNAMASL